MRNILILSISLILFVCTRSIPWGQFELEKLDGEIFSMDMPEAGKVHLFFFLSPECPLCQSYSKNIQAYKDLYSNDSLKVIGIFPGLEYSVEEISAFQLEYQLDIPFLLDPEFVLTKYLQAKITPEAILVDDRGKVRYQGAIDDWAVTVRKHRQKISEFYLNDAIQSVLNGEKVANPKTEAVGCFIQ